MKHGLLKDILVLVLTRTKLQYTMLHHLKFYSNFSAGKSTHRVSLVVREAVWSFERQSPDL